MALRSALILRKPRSGCLEGRTTLIPPRRDARFGYAAAPQTDVQTLSRCSTAAVSARTCRVSAASLISDSP